MDRRKKEVKRFNKEDHLKRGNKMTEEEITLMKDIGAKDLDMKELREYVVNYGQT